MNKQRGTLIVFTGPSGVGKGTVMGEFRKLNHPFYFSVSAATRKPRQGEVDGVNYCFISVDEFEQMIKQNKLMEYTKYVDNYYGTPCKPVMDNLENGIDVVLEIETQGAMQIKEKCPEAVLVFLAPPSIQILQSRLIGRGTETNDVVDKRMSEAMKELKQAGNFDYIIINNLADVAADELLAIIKAEKCKTAKRIDLIK